MPKYPLSIAGIPDFPNRPDGSVIYGQHMNSVQDEIMAIESTLGPGDSTTSGIWSLRSAPDGKSYGNLVDRLTDYTNRIQANERHVASSTGVHGIGPTSAVVGTATVQVLTNKTLVGPVLQGTVGASGVTFTGNVTFANDVTVLGTLRMSKPPVITDFTQSQHNHADAKGGGKLPISSITGLQAALDGKAPLKHTHLRSEITDFAHALDSDAHTGTLPYSKVSGLGTAAVMNVPTKAGVAAAPGELVRGDDPRMADTRTPKAHASTHRASGTDPITPAMIGAAQGVHSHPKSQITDFAHPLNSSYHTGTLPQSKVDGLVDALANKLPLHGIADDSRLIGGHRITVGSSQPGGTPNAGDIWIVS